MAYLAKLQKGQSLSREAAFSAVTQPQTLKDNPEYEWIYDGQKLGEDFPMWQDAYRALVSRISHKVGIPAGYVAQRESAPSPNTLRRLYGPGVYKVEIRGPMMDKNGVKKRYGKLALYTVVIPFEEKYPNQTQTCAHCKYFRADKKICLKHKWMMTPDQVCGHWEEIMKKKPYISAGAGLAGDIGSMDDVVFNNAPPIEKTYLNSKDTKYFLDGPKIQDVGTSPKEPLVERTEPLKPSPPPDQYDFIRALSRKIDTESED